MPEPTAREIALATLEAYIQYASEPALTSTEVGDLLDRHAVATAYAASATVCVPGTRVVPAVANGRMYVSVSNTLGGTYTTAGTLTATSWPIGPYGWPDGNGNQIVDGTVTWENDSPAPASLWGLKAAAREGWLMKAAKVVGCPDIADGSMRSANGLLSTLCLAMANRYQQIGVS